MVPKKEGGYRPVINLKALNLFVVEVLQDGGRPYGEVPSREQRLDGKDGYEGCLLFSANASRSSEASPVPMMGTTYQFCCLSFKLS